MSALPLCTSFLAFIFYFFSFLHSSTVLLISLCLTIGSIALVASRATVGLQSLPEFRFMSSSTWLRTQSATCHWSKQHLWWSLCHPPRNSPAEHYLQHLVPCCRLAHPSTLHRVTHSVTLLRLRAGEEKVCLSAERKVNKKTKQKKAQPWILSTSQACMCIPVFSQGDYFRSTGKLTPQHTWRLVTNMQL